MREQLGDPMETRLHRQELLNGLLLVVVSASRKHLGLAGLKCDDETSAPHEGDHKTPQQEKG